MRFNCLKIDIWYFGVILKVHLIAFVPFMNDTFLIETYQVGNRKHFTKASAGINTTYIYIYKNSAREALQNRKVFSPFLKASTDCGVSSWSWRAFHSQGGSGSFEGPVTRSLEASPGQEQAVQLAWFLSRFWLRYVG